MEKYKTVALPISVPIGKYCWDRTISAVCPYFDNEGGFNSCDLNLDDALGLKEDEAGVLKPDSCKMLKTVTE